jgi:hypothetical protein
MRLRLGVHPRIQAGPARLDLKHTRALHAFCERYTPMAGLLAGQGRYLAML